MSETLPIEGMRAERLKAGLSLRALGKKTGIHYSQLSRYENGLQVPDVDQDILAAALVVPREVLFPAGPTEAVA